MTKEHPTKPPRTAGDKHTSYAARLVRRTVGASPQSGGPGTRRLWLQRTASAPTRVEATCLSFSCTLRHRGVVDFLKTQPVEL